MTQPVYPPSTAQIAARRKQLAPGIHDAFQEFGRQVFAEGALDEKTNAAGQAGDPAPPSGEPRAPGGG